MVLTVEIDEADLRVGFISNAVVGAEYHCTVCHLPSGTVGRASNTSQIAARAAAMADLKRQLSLD